MDSSSPPPPESLSNCNALVRSPLVLMAPRVDGIEAIWAVSRLSRGYLELETAGGEHHPIGCDPFGYVPQGDEVIRMRLGGLASGASYRVRSITTAAENGEIVTSDWKTFRTLDSSAASTRFVVWNDTHENEVSIRQLHEITPIADFLMWNGDTCGDCMDKDSMVPSLLHPGGCDISAGRPLFHMWGNHDVRGPYAFRVPGIIATPNGRPFYAFRSGPVAVICLHTGEDKPDDHPSFCGRVAFDTLRAEQAAWLAEVIQRPEMRDAPYRIVFCHIPLRWTDESPQDYTRGYDRFSERSRTAWHDLLVAWQTQIVVSGHTHRATWLPPTDEWPYGQLVGGGPEPERATWIDCSADDTELRVRMRNLAGEILYDLTFPPLA